MVYRILPIWLEGYWFYYKRNMVDDDYEIPARSYTRADYRGMLNYEGILGGHIQKLMMYRDTNPRLYCSSVETLILHCPHIVRDKALKKLSDLGLQRGAYNNINEEKLLIYDDLLIYINEQLEKANLIFKTGTFEVGHD